MNLRVGFHLILLFLTSLSALNAQSLKPWLNPQYRIHRNIVDSQFLKAEKKLIKRSQTKDTASPIYWHSLSRLATHHRQNNQAIFFSRNASIKANAAFMFNPEIKQEFLKWYYFDETYLNLYYRKLLYDKYNQERSTTDPNQNIELLQFFQNEQTTLEKHFPKNGNINTKISLPHIIYCLSSLNDTIAFKQALSTNKITDLQKYTLIWRAMPDSSSYPAHLLSLYTQATDSLYKMAFNEAEYQNTEEAYLKFIDDYPKAPQQKQALSLADNLAFIQSKQINSTVAYSNYLNKYPFGKHKKTASYLLRYLKITPVPFYTKRGKFAFVDSITLEKWTDSTYDFAFPFAKKYHTQWFSNGAHLIPECAMVMKYDLFDNPEYHYIEKDGTPISNNKYSDLPIQIQKNLAFVTKSERYGLLNSTGKELLPCKFPKIYFDTASGLGALYNGTHWAFYNKQGKILTPFEFDDISELNEYSLQSPVDLWNIPKTRILVQKGTNLYFLDSNFKPISDTFQSCTQFVPGFYWINKMNVGKFTDTGLTAIAVGLKKEPLWIQSNNQVYFCINDKTESTIYNQDFQPIKVHKKLQFETVDNKIFTASVKVNASNNKRGNTSSWGQKWLNPSNWEISKPTAQSIAILNDSLIGFTTDTTFKLKKDSTVSRTHLVNIITEKTVHPNPHFSISRSDNSQYFLTNSSDGFMGLIDLKGNTVLPEDYLQIESSQFPGTWIVQSPHSEDEGGYELVTKGGNAIISNYHFNEIVDQMFQNYLLISEPDRSYWMNQKGKIYSWQ
jgi:hypothetical protein